MTAEKNDTKDNKPDLSLLPKIFKTQVAYTMMAGKFKYGKYNYTKGHKISQLLAAAERHLDEIKDGVDYDDDCTARVGVAVHHAGCVAANMLMLLHQLELGTLIDDRFKKEED